MEDLNRVVVLLLALPAVWIAAPPAVASVKGYDSGPWWFGCGLVGVLVLAFLPRLGSTRPEAARWQAVADRLGRLLSGLQLSSFGVACAVSAWRTYLR